MLQSIGLLRQAIRNRRIHLKLEAEILLERSSFAKVYGQQGYGYLASLRLVFRITKTSAVMAKDWAF